MGLPIVIADANGTDLYEIEDHSLDCAFGDDENQIEITVDPAYAPPAGGYAYIDGTEYGGTIDSIKASTTRSGGRVVTASGRSWHGVLAGKILVPDSGQSHLSVSGPVASVLQSLIDRMGLGWLFSAPAAESDDATISYQFERFVDALSGIRSMLKSSSLKLSMRRSDGMVVLGARAVVDYGNKVDSDLIDFDITATTRRVNHLVCGGTGENESRTIIHFYADANGEVSHTQTLFGVDEIAGFYDYSNADEEKLEEDGRKKLEEMQGDGEVEVSVHDDIDVDIGDIVSARDNSTGLLVSAEVVKKIVTVSSGVASFDYEVGSPASGNSSTRISGSGEYSGGGGHAYYAGDGISIEGYTISADVNTSDLEAVTASANDARRVASEASAAAGLAMQEAASKAPIDHTHTIESLGITPQAIGAAEADHTHNYAGATSPGGVATSAERLSEPRTINITGAVSGSASFDGSGDITITTEGDSEVAGFLSAHPVGSLYETTYDANPSASYGGAWVPLPSVSGFVWERTA